MKRRFAIVLLASCALAAQQPGAVPALHPDVALLLARETRQQAMERILARGVHRGDGTYEEGEHPFKVGHVAVCPQQRGMPMMAVFGIGVTNQLEHRARGHVILVAPDGVIVRCWQGNNVVDDDAVFADVNGDGLVERIETMNYGFGDDGGRVRELFVIAIAEGAVPSLRVAVDAGTFPKQPEDQMGWRVDPCGNGEPAWIRIGPKDPVTGGLKEVIAEWRWYGDRKSWVGPGGGPDQPFVRLPPVGSAGLEEFLAAQRRNRDR